jgi:hypothetical protein
LVLHRQICIPSGTIHSLELGPLLGSVGDALSSGLRRFRGQWASRRHAAIRSADQIIYALLSDKPKACAGCRAYAAFSDNALIDAISIATLDWNAPEFIAKLWGAELCNRRAAALWQD